MTDRLAASALETYTHDGYLAPLRALSPSDTSTVRVEVEHFVDRNTRARGDASALRTKAHLHCPALLELVRHPAIVGPVTDILGRDLLCRSSSLFVKDPGDPAFVAWHQDAAYWELDPPDVATAWIAITESTTANGALQVLPGSHRAPLLRHHTVDEPGNMLSQQQAIADPIDPGSSRTLTLDAGEMSIHHVALAHGSRPNASSGRRIGFAIRYVAPHVRKTGSRRDSAILVSGTDRFGHFDPDPEKIGDR
jgi:ectoine hydroxylase-related dioxygenase (phytanoyl-CoA dioxygenase family)